MFADNIAALESFFPVLTFKSVPLFVELSGEEGEGDLPSFGCVSSQSSRNLALKRPHTLYDR